VIGWLRDWLDPPLPEAEEQAIDEALRRCPVRAYPWLDWCPGYPLLPEDGEEGPDSGFNSAPR